MDHDFEQDFECCFTYDTFIALLRVRRAATSHTFIFTYGVSACDFEQFVACLNSVFTSYLLVIYNLSSLHAMRSQQ